MVGGHGVRGKQDAMCEPSCRTGGACVAPQMRHWREGNLSSQQAVCTAAENLQAEWRINCPRDRRINVAHNKNSALRLNEKPKSRSMGQGDPHGDQAHIDRPQCTQELYVGIRL